MQTGGEAKLTRCAEGVSGGGSWVRDSRIAKLESREGGIRSFHREGIAGK
jgi:hypothetical protein